MRVAIIDHGHANVFSLVNACMTCGIEPEIASSPQQLRDIDAVLLPGVGAFGKAMAALRDRGLVGPIRELASAGTPLLGICLGMQMLMDASDEFGDCAGLGLIPGGVRCLSSSKAKVPHVGWAAIECSEDAPILRNMKNCPMYFVHSFHAVTTDPTHTIAVSRHGGESFAAVTGRGNIYGCQFHPERSGSTGLSLLTNFFYLVGSVKAGRVSR